MKLKIVFFISLAIAVRWKQSSSPRGCKPDHLCHDQGQPLMLISEALAHGVLGGDVSLFVVTRSQSIRTSSSDLITAGKALMEAGKGSALQSTEPAWSNSNLDKHVDITAFVI